MTALPDAKPCRFSLTRDILTLALLLALLFGALAGQRPLAPPSEGRYAEIPREMLESGDFVTPRLNGIKYFEKPPMFYWLQASALKVFGGSEAALRFWPSAMALIGCLAVFLAGRAFWGRQAGWIAAGILATSALWFGLSRQIVLDMTVTAFITVSLLCFISATNATEAKLKARLYDLMYVAAALATLTKGLIGIVIPGFIVFVWLALSGRWRILREARLFSGAALFLLIVVPWHWLVARDNPEFSQFYFIHEHFERFTTRVHDRYAPPWFFVPVLLAGLLPWLPLLPGAMRHAVDDAWRNRTNNGISLFLLIWAGAVFVFFSASSSKLVPYILPCLPPIVLLMGKWVARSGPATPSRLPLGLSLGLLGLLGIAFALVASGAAQPLFAGKIRVAEMLARAAPYLWPIAIAAITSSLIAAVLLWRQQMQAAIAVLAIGSGLVWIELDAASGPFLERSAKPLAEALKPRLRNDDIVVAYRDYLQDFTYYIGRRVEIVEWRGELDFGLRQEDHSRTVYSAEDFQRRWQSGARMFAVSGVSEFDKLVKEPGFSAVELARTARHVLFANGPAASPP